MISAIKAKFFFPLKSPWEVSTGNENDNEREEEEVDGEDGEEREEVEEIRQTSAANIAGMPDPVIEWISDLIQDVMEKERRGLSAVVGGVVTFLGMLALGPVGLLVGALSGGLTYAAMGDDNLLRKLHAIRRAKPSVKKTFVEKIAGRLPSSDERSNSTARVERVLRDNPNPVIAATKDELSEWRVSEYHR
jgi:hypothetical protein